MIKQYTSLIQINEIKTELNSTYPDLFKMIKLFREIFQILQKDPAAQTLIEVDSLCTSIYIRKDYDLYPEYFKDIIYSSLTLHDYPSKYAAYSPQEILTKINIIYKEFNIQNMNIITKKERILELFNDKVSINEISRLIKEDVSLIKKVLHYEGYI